MFLFLQLNTLIITIFINNNKYYSAILTYILFNQNKLYNNYEFLIKIFIQKMKLVLL